MNLSTEENFFDRAVTRVRESPISILILTLLVVSLNIWFDYSHPLGFFIDVVLLFALFKSYLKSRYRMEKGTKSCLVALPGMFVLLKPSCPVRAFTRS